MHDSTSDYIAIALELRKFQLISIQPECRSVLTALAGMYEALAERPHAPANANEPGDDPAFAS